MDQQPSAFWSVPAAQVLKDLETAPEGLSAAEAASRLERYAARRLTPKKRTDTLTLLLGQFSSPIVLLLLGATAISLLLHDPTDAAIILAIVLASGLLGFWQERGAAGAVEKLLSLVEVKAQVLRNGAAHEVPLADVVPGDVVRLSAGAAAPGDCLLLEARDLFADEATLTGETFPAEKAVAVLAVETPLSKRTNAVFMGTHMVSGSATAVVVAIGRDTEFGAVADRLKLRPPETDFERGVRRFGYLLLEVTLLLVIGIFAVNVYLHRPVLDSFLFSEDRAGITVPLASVREQIDTRFAEYGVRGQRTLGLARKRLGSETRIGKDSEAGMSFLGFLLFSDPPKLGIAATIGRLRELGVGLKVITGDNALVAATVARAIGFGDAHVLSGPELRLMSDGALLNRVSQVDLFAEVEPNQKERLILALRKAGHVVGYMGDGINDASALHAADVGLSVEGAVDVAKQVADIVLLEKNLDVLIEGVREGRTTFANTLKYVLMATSANFGNMFSMAGASLLLPFLPLLPKQILLTNLLTDLPEMTIASDGVDAEMLVKPRRWDIGFIRAFMLTFGVLSSIFDFLTFGALLYILHADTEQFRTGWFVESVLSAALVVLVVRTRHLSFRSRPGKRLQAATLGVILATLGLPFLPFAPLLGLTPLPLFFLALLTLIVAMYICSAELAKRLFYRHIEPLAARQPIGTATI